MSAGNPILKMRVPQEVLDWIESRIAARNEVSRDEPWDVSAYLRWLIATDQRHQAAAARQGVSRRAKAQKGGT